MSYTELKSALRLNAGFAWTAGLLVLAVILIAGVLSSAPSRVAAQSHETIASDTPHNNDAQNGEVQGATLQAPEDDDEDTATGTDKVTLCHFDDETDTYAQISVSVNAILNGEGHAGHTQDIIPPFDGFVGLNTDATSTAILNNSCVDPNAPPPGDDEDDDDDDSDDMIALHTQKIVCDDESDLPNWGAGDVVSSIGTTTAADWLAAHPGNGCHLADWNFQWMNDATSSANPGDQTGVAGGAWSSPFNGSTVVNVDDVSRIWVREVADNAYIPFGGGNTTATTSAEMYCDTDVLNYDNFEFIDTPDDAHAPDYYCVAWNVLQQGGGDDDDDTKGTTSIKIIKQVSGTTTSALFGFDASWLDADIDFSLGAGASTTYTGLATGTYMLSELVGTSSPFILQNVVCTDNNASTTNSVSTTTPGVNASVTLGADEDIVCTFTNGLPAGTTSPFAQVHIYKYLAGTTTVQIPDTATTTPFPMRASWDASNIGAGTGNYVLGTNFGGAALKYAADTSAMATPVTLYTTFERTTDIDGTSTVLPAGAQCAPDMFRLVGYKSGTSLAAAEAATATTTVPVFNNFSTDEYVIVVNEDCDNPIPPPPTATTSSLTIVKDIAGTSTATTTFDFDASWLGTTTPDFSLADGALTVFGGLATGTYTVSEILGTSSPYTLQSVNCTGDGTATSTANGIAVTFSTAGNATCTFTNALGTTTPPVNQCTIAVVSDTLTTVNEHGGAAAKLVTFIHPAWTALINGASWIWGDDPVVDPVATTTYTFTRNFTWNGTTSAATLDVASDNTYTVSLNGTGIGTSTDGNNFALGTQDSYDVASALVNGTNTIVFSVTNWELPGAATSSENPAGLMFRLSATSTDPNCTQSPSGGGGGGGGGGEVLGASTGGGGGGGGHSSHRRNGGGGNNNGQVLGASTSNNPDGSVLGALFPGFPNTGSGGGARTLASLGMILAGLTLAAISFKVFRQEA